MITTNRIRTKLVLPSADAGLAWYASTLDATIAERTEFDGAVVYAELTVLGTQLTVKDTDAVDPPTAHLILDVVLEDPDPTWHDMVRAGAEIVFPLADQHYGQRGGRLRDPFGIQWILSGPLRGDPPTGG